MWFESGQTNSAEGPGLHGLLTDGRGGPGDKPLCGALVAIPKARRQVDLLEWRQGNLDFRRDVAVVYQLELAPFVLPSETNVSR
jgi:hypothetical protein